MTVNLEIDDLLFDYSFSIDTTKEMEKGFGQSLEQESNIRGRLGLNFQANQRPPSFATPSNITNWGSSERNGGGEVISEEDGEISTGFPGPPGFFGPIGPRLGSGSGNQGAVGTVGPTGPEGIQGTEGPTGYGLTGPDGSTGKTGPEGILGKTGPVGIPGSSGRGATGPAGVGPTGPTGSTGSGKTGPALDPWDPPCECCIGEEIAWIKFPDPTYPSLPAGDDRQCTMGETHSFILYYKTPAGVPKILDYHKAGNYDNGNDTWYYNDANDHSQGGSTITQKYKPKFLDDHGDSDGFLAANVATDFTQNECWQLDAYRRGLGEPGVIWGESNLTNELDGHGVCGCSEQTALGMSISMEQVRVNAVTELGLWPGNDDWGSDNPFCDPTWELGNSPAQVNHEWKTNSKGRFLIGDALWWHGWRTPGPDAQSGTVSCHVVDGCHSIWAGGEAQVEYNCEDNWAWPKTPPMAHGYDPQGYQIEGCKMGPGADAFCDCILLDSRRDMDPYDTCYYDLEDEWGGVGCDDNLGCGLFYCDVNMGNSTWGVTYSSNDSDDMIEAYTPDSLITYAPSNPHFNMYDEATCPPEGDNCYQWQCSRQDSYAANDDTWYDHGKTGMARLWNGDPIVSDEGQEFHNQAPWGCEAAEESVVDCNAVVTNSIDNSGKFGVGCHRTIAEYYGYYTSDLIYRPPHSDNLCPNGLLLDHAGNRRSSPLCDHKFDGIGDGYTWLKYVIPKSSGDATGDEYGQPFTHSWYAPPSRVLIAPGEYTHLDFMPVKMEGQLAPSAGQNHCPRKPFPTLVMNGKTMADELRDHFANNPSELDQFGTEVLTVDLHVMVLTSWCVKSVASSGDRCTDGPGWGGEAGAMASSPWPLYDPWPHLAPHVSEHWSWYESGHPAYENFYGECTYKDCDGCGDGCSCGERWGDDINHLYAYWERPRAPWHCYKGGKEDGNNCEKIARGGRSMDWDEPWDGLCLGRFEECLSDQDNSEGFCGYDDPADVPGTLPLTTTHAGSRYYTGLPAFSYHGDTEPHQFTDKPGIAPWDAMDNGVDVYYARHWLNGVYLSPIDCDCAVGGSDDPNDFNEDTYKNWYWHQNAAGPFKRWEETDAYKGGWPIHSDVGSGNGINTEPHISRMHHYLTDYFDLPKWSFEIETEWTNTNAIELSYMTLTDYTIETACIY